MGEASCAGTRPGRRQRGRRRQSGAWRSGGGRECENQLAVIAAASPARRPRTRCAMWGGALPVTHGTAGAHQLQRLQGAGTSSPGPDPAPSAPVPRLRFVRPEWWTLRMRPMMTTRPVSPIEAHTARTGGSGLPQRVSRPPGLRRQESWLRLSRADTSDVENLGGWLTTVVGRVCLDTLRSRTSRREEPLDTHLPEPTSARGRKRSRAR